MCLETKKLNKLFDVFRGELKVDVFEQMRLHREHVRVQREKQGKKFDVKMDGMNEKFLCHDKDEAVLNVKVDNLTSEFKEFKGEIKGNLTWLTRLIIGGIVLGVLAFFFKY